MVSRGSMRVNISELMTKLGVGHVLKPGDSSPWLVYDPAKGLTCSADVRVDMDGNEVEAEAQFIYDIPPAGKPGMEQICYIKAQPVNDGLWTSTLFRLKGETVGNEMYNWQEKCCAFFSALVQALRQNEIPDIEELINLTLKSKDRLADQRGGGGGKSPKIRPAQLLDMKKGGKGF